MEQELEPSPITRAVFSSSFKKIFIYLIYLFDCTGSYLQYMGSSVFTAACWILSPDQGWPLGPLHWKYRVLATGATSEVLPSQILSAVLKIAAIPAQPHISAYWSLTSF